MKRYILAYRAYLRAQLAREDCDAQVLLENHLRQTAFIQHERLAHLIILVLFALTTAGCAVAAALSALAGLYVLTAALLCLLAPYIAHYYFLENQTQALYRDYNTLMNRLGKSDFTGCEKKDVQ
ncbi:MAG: hypothetical protein QM689_05240 [Oscillospiraceae bacterium]